MKGFYLSPQNYPTGYYDVDTYTMGLDSVTFAYFESGPLFLWQRIVIEHSRISFLRLY